MKKLLLTASVFTAMLSANAQMPGEIDSTFGIDGTIYNDFIPNTGEFWWDMIVLNDDKLMKIGYEDDGNNKNVAVAKFKQNGSPDSTFANNGILSIDIGLGLAEEGRGLYEMDNGQILITGFRVNANLQAINGFLMRLDSDGTIDDTFGSTNPGITEFNAGDNSVAFGRSIKIVANEIYVGASARFGGQSDMVLYNFLMDGTIDNSFASGGFAQVDINGEDDLLISLEVTSNGRFVLGGTADLAGNYQASITVLSSFGTPTSFGNQTIDFGLVRSEIRDIYIDANDYVYACGSQGIAPDIDGFVVRYKNDFSGDLDDTWGSAGIVESNPGATIEMQFWNVMPVWDGGIVVTGNLEGAAREHYAMMLTATGDFQTEFDGGDVYLPLAINTVALSALCAGTQSDGSIIIGGNLQSQDFIGSNGVMLRLAPYKDVTGITELASQSLQVFPNPVINSFQLDLENIQSVQLISLEGRVVAAWNSEENAYVLPSNVNSGVYILQVQALNAFGTTRIVVQ